LPRASEHLSELVRQLEDRVSVEVDQAAIQSRRALSEELNQMMRRLRPCESTEEVARWLVDSASSFGGPAALFEVTGEQVRGVLSRGFDGVDRESVEVLDVPLAEAPALRDSIQQRETVVASGAAAEVSSRIFDALRQTPGGKVHLYPMMIQEKVVAVLYVTGQNVESAALELLTEAAGRMAQILSAEERPVVSKPAPELIGISGVDMRPNSTPPTDLRRAAREARARWFARSEVARMRLAQRKALERGRMERDIYSALRPQIEAARRSYRQDFLAVSPVIVDYLHRELVGLANNDPNLLGPEYPGSLV
jgi:hypothetical protein